MARAFFQTLLMPVTLSQLLADFSGLPSQWADTTVTSLSCDSRSVEPGALFFALPGMHDDGSRYIQEALQKGAVCVLVDAALRVDHPKVLSVPNARLWLAGIAARFYDHPSRKMQLVGITGTNGKTTISYLLSDLWGQNQSAIIGTTGIRLGQKFLPATHTTPDPISLQKILANVVQNKIPSVAMEVSSHALAQYRVDGCDFDVAIFSNLTQDHLDYHHNFEDYFLAKARFFTEVLPHSEKKTRVAVINIDDPWGEKLLRKISALSLSVLTFAVDNPAADFHAREIQTSLAGSSFQLHSPHGIHAIKTNLIGKHNVSNILATLTALSHDSAAIFDNLAPLENIRIPGRLEAVPNSSGIHAFVDYAHTPDALENVLSTLKKLATQQKSPTRLMTVFGCGGDRDKGKRPLMGKSVAKFSDRIIITSDNPRTENPQDIINDILPGLLDHPTLNKESVTVEIDRSKAIECAVASARPGDIILVAGKGHEDYQIIGTTKVPFDDRLVLKERLKT